MPCISKFYGISIYMYYRDHAPPHFHAFYGEDEAVIEIASGSISEGKLSRRASKLVQEWTSTNREALERNWEHARNGEPLDDIPGLE